MTPIIALLLNVMILGALGFTIYYCFRLSRQFRQLQADRRAFEALIQSLNVASARAEAAIRAMKEAATSGGESLQEKINAARSIAGELEVMVQAGDSLANRLQGLAETARRAHVPAPTPAPAGGEDTANLRTRAEKDLAEALKARKTT